MVELVGVEVLFSSSSAPRYEQIFSQRFCSDEFASSIWPDTAGEITTRRKEWIIPRILVEMDRTRALFLSELALRCEQIFPREFCSGEFASSILAVFETIGTALAVQNRTGSSRF